MMENTAKLLNEIAGLKEYKHQVGKALARIENWQKEDRPDRSHGNNPCSKQTLERILSIFREEGVSK